MINVNAPKHARATMLTYRWCVVCLDNEWNASVHFGNPLIYTQLLLLMLFIQATQILYSADKNIVHTCGMEVDTIAI